MKSQHKILVYILTSHQFHSKQKNYFLPQSYTFFNIRHWKDSPLLHPLLVPAVNPFILDDPFR